MLKFELVCNNMSRDCQVTDNSGDIAIALGNVTDFSDINILF